MQHHPLDPVPTPPEAARTSLGWFALRSVCARLPGHWSLWLAVPLVALVSLIVSSAPVPAVIPKVNLAADPLYAAASGDKATLALALSVEFPTVGAQYTAAANSATDNSYANTVEYLGYYDAEACYRYNNAPTETPPTGMALADLKRFDRTGAATNRMCTNGFSGNFLNWASNSAVDMLRLALSGGDRYVDTPDLTILQRAVVPNGDPICMWNSTNFPAKQLRKDGGGTGMYWGAVPTAMINAANGNDIWVANTLNRIYFGSARGGSCGDPSSYNLSGATPAIGTIVTRNDPLPLDALLSQCALENGNCSFSGAREVWYGANNRWKVAPAANGVACTNAVFGDPVPGTPKACYTRPTTWTPPASASALNTDGFFYARAQVCNVDGSGVLQDVRNYGADVVLCRQYPSGKYKPGGAIQKYSEQLRLAAFGYALEQTASYNNGRYGGVLRAPMKYVGGKTFDENGIDNTAIGGNPAREWDLNTGVFLPNPNGDITQTPAISGVINYLNKFGRTGPVQGRYKQYDPVGELHYEVLRYLQGLQPSAAAINGLTAAMYDGFPLYTTWTDPYGGARTNASDYSCLKSNIVVIGDVNTHDGNRLPTPSAANNIPDIAYWRGIVRAFESNSATTYVDGQGNTRTTGNPNGSNGNSPGGSQTSQIMGSAYWALTHDIRGTGWTAAPTLQRPGLRVKTFTFDVNENGTQSNANTRRTSNQFFMAAKYGGFETKEPTSGGKVFNSTGNPFKQEDGINNNNVWQKLDDPGEAGTYYLQSGARGVLNAFEDIFSRASSGARSIGGSSATSRDLTAQSGSLVFQGSFNTEDWSGDVLANSVTLSNDNLTISEQPTWSASTMLDARPNPATSRTIVVGNDAANPVPTALPFLWGNLTGTMRTALNKPDPTMAADNYGARRVNYLRGDRSDETPVDTALFRKRNRLLGDVVNSGVVYSGKLSSNASNAPGYAAFAAASAARTAAVYVGANDGMLHAFNATDGSELFAYIPSWVVPNLSALTGKAYASNHRSYVDGPPVVAAANISASTTPDWRTVLVSGTGGGGKGVFALDVTNPSTFSASNVMWEFTDAHDIDMGHVVGRPQILRLRTSASGATPVTYKWFAVVASGVNNYVGSYAGDYSEGRPALFLLDLGKAVGTPWALGTNYFKISIPTDTTLAATTPTGLLNFKAEIGTAGDVQRIYMGDLHGRLWRLDFNRAGGTADWTMGGLSAFRTSYGGACTTPCAALPLFVAKDSSGRVQPITMAPTIAFSGSSKANYVVVGTGKYLEVADKTTSGQQSFYALYDDIEALNQPSDDSGGTSIIKDRSRLKAGTVNASNFGVTVNSFLWGRRTETPANLNVFSGWYIDFPDAGERQVSNIVLNGDILEFNTLYPASTTANVCGSNDGGGNSYALNLDTGAGTFRRSNVGVLGEAMVLQVKVLELNRTDPNAISASDSTGRRIRRVTTTTLGPGSKGLATVNTTTQDIIIGRLSWRRINNYHELKQ